MRKMDHNGEILCRYQADLFEYSTFRRECSTKVFIKAFVYSDIARDLDNLSILFDSRDIVQAYEEISAPNRGKEIYPASVCSWIGYLMRYWAYTYETETINIYKKIKPGELYGLYQAYHSLSPEEAVQRIMEAKEINTDLNRPDILKKIYML